MDSKESNKKTNKTELQYAIEDIPPWYTAIFLGFQVRHLNSIFTVVCVLCSICAHSSGVSGALSTMCKLSKT